MNGGGGGGGVCGWELREGERDWEIRMRETKTERERKKDWETSNDGIAGNGSFKYFNVIYGFVKFFILSYW